MKRLAMVLMLAVGTALPRGALAQETKAAARARPLDVPGALWRYSVEGRGPVVVAFTGSENIGHALYSDGLRQHLTIVNADPSWIPAERIATLSMSDVVEDIERVRVALGVERISLMGHSMFAPVPLEYALRYPEHAGWSIVTGGLPYTTSKAFQASKAYWDTAASPERKAIHAANLTALEAPGGAGRSVTERFWDRYAADAPLRFANPRFELGGFVKAVAVKPGLENGFIDRFWGVVLKDFDHTAEYRRIRTPVLVMAGKYDFGAPWFLWKGVGTGMADYTFHLFENAGHNPMLETPADFDRFLVAWMAGRPLGSEVRTTRSGDGVRIRYMVAGLGQPGAPIVFVHGFTNNRSFWEPHFSAFARSHPVVAVDLAGFGESGADRTAWTMRAYGQDVLAVLKDLDLRGAVLVGFSMGAGAVLEAAAQDPARVRGVVLVDWLHDPESRTPPGFAGMFLGNMQKSWHTPAFFRGPPQIEPLPDSLIARYDASTPDRVPAHWRPIIEETFRWANDDLVAGLKALRVPLAAINTDQPATNVVAYRLYARSFQLRLMPRLSHLGAIWQETALFDRQLEDLAQGMQPGIAKAAPAPAVPAPDASAMDVRRFIEESNARLELWYRTGQIDSVAPYFAEDARQMASGAPPLVGREAIRAFWGQATRAGEWDFALATQEVTASGGVAAERGLYAVRYTPGPSAPKELSASTSDHGRYVVLWRKEADGRWRIAWDAAVSDVAPPPPAKP